MRVCYATDVTIIICIEVWWS